MADSDLLGALVELAHGSAVVEGHVAGGKGHVTKHQRHRQNHVICEQGETSGQTRLTSTFSLAAIQLSICLSHRVLSAPWGGAPGQVTGR